MTRALLLALVAGAALAACDVGQPYSPPPDPPPPLQTRVERVVLTPDTVAVGDTVLIHCVIRDSLDARFRFRWGMQTSTVLPVDGRLDGPRIRFIAPRTSDVPGRVVNAGTYVYITSGVPGSRGVSYHFAIPIRN